MLNNGYLKSSHNLESDEWYTPDYAVLPLIKYLKKNKFKVIWCPFDEEFSEYVRIFKKYKFQVIYTHKNLNEDFFKIKPPKNFDILISNPPYSIKDQVLEKCYKLKKPFALLLPLPTLQSIKRFNFFKSGLELLVFDKRISFKKDSNGSLKKGNCFASIYFCKDFLPEKLIFEKLKDGSKSNKMDKNEVWNKMVNSVIQRK